MCVCVRAWHAFPPEFARLSCLSSVSALPSLNVCLLNDCFGQQRLSDRYCLLPGPLFLSPARIVPSWRLLPRPLQMGLLPLQRRAQFLTQFLAYTRSSRARAQVHARRSGQGWQCLDWDGGSPEERIVDPSPSHPRPKPALHCLPGSLRQACFQHRLSDYFVACLTDS